jgi:hypothetical protein
MLGTVPEFVYQPSVWLVLYATHAHKRIVYYSLRPFEFVIQLARSLTGILADNTLEAV